MGSEAASTPLRPPPSHPGVSYQPVPGVVCRLVFIKENIFVRPCPISIYPDRGSEHGRVCFPRSADRCGDGCHGRYSREGTLPRTPERGAGFCYLSPPETEAQTGWTTPADLGRGASPVPGYLHRSRSAERVAVVAHRVNDVAPGYDFCSRPGISMSSTDHTSMTATEFIPVS